MEATFKKKFTIVDPYTHQGLSNHSTLVTIYSGATVSIRCIKITRFMNLVSLLTVSSVVDSV
jgi:hypothetical protein